MCGIVGYIGQKNALEPVLEGLKTLEYRGYDSAGVSFVLDGRARTVKNVGRVEALEAELTDVGAGLVGPAIGHTRWATHGAPTTLNAHPHHNEDDTIFVVHNGIIENYEVLRQMLIDHGYHFVSQTDTEVIPHLIDFYTRSNESFDAALIAALNDLRGAYSVAVLNSKEADRLYVARVSSPLIVGVGDNEMFAASDPTAIASSTNRIVYLDDYEMAVLTRNDYTIYNYKLAADVQRNAEVLEYDREQAALGDFPHFMLKEIFEAPHTVKAATLGRVRPETNTIKLGGLEQVTQQMETIDRIDIVACGTSYYAGLVGEYFLEELAGIPVEVHLASEYKYRKAPISRSTAVLAISQSGETADTIAALEKVKNYGVLRLGIVNAVGSTISRITDAGVYCHAGPEQSVASTKAFIAQVTVLLQIALHLSEGRTPLYKSLLDGLADLPHLLEEVLKQDKHIKRVAKKYAHHRDFLYIGRGNLYPCALEGALKLKEISYIHAEGYAAGEMKHGPLAMIDESFPTFAIACNNKLLEKTVSNIQEIKARKGPVVAVVTKGSDITNMVDDAIEIPDAPEHLQPFLVAVVLQLFSYYAAIELGHNVDRPRNLAKSVTVE